MAQKLSRKYRKFSPEFRDEAVRLVIDNSRPVAQVARELGVNEGTLGNWVNLYRNEHADEEPPLTPAEPVSTRWEVDAPRSPRAVSSVTPDMWPFWTVVDPDRCAASVMRTALANLWEAVTTGRGRLAAAWHVLGAWVVTAVGRVALSRRWVSTRSRGVHGIRR